MKLLIIEDEPELALDISRYLQSQDYRCEIASNFEQAKEKIDLYQYDCILLDIMLPGGSGMNLLAHLRNLNRAEGVIIISAKNALEDKIAGLKIGADDYLAKPFHLSELAARVFSVIRRKQFKSENVLVQNELTVDLQAKTVLVNGENLPLTKKEFALLLLFIGNKNKVLPKSAVAEHLSGDVADMFDNHDFVYAHVKNLKKKLSEAGCANYIKTVYGTGYKWEE